MDVIFAWAANLILIVGSFCLSPKSRWPLACMMIGDSAWVGVGVARGQADIAFICVVFTVIAARNLRKWRSEP
jgi:hypothetical protein